MKIHIASTFFTLALILFTFAQVTLAQEDSEATTPLSDETVIEKWEFGLEISSGGNATGVLASVPIPIEWPEQKIKNIEENKPAPITRLSYKELGDNGKQLIIKINRLKPGDVVTASVILEIEKSMIVEPENPDRFRFANKSETRRLNTYLKPSPYIESRHRRIKALAESIEIDESLSPYEQVRTIFEWIRDNIEYEFDVTIRTCLEALDRKKGDCEELSSLFIAVCRAKGIPARAVWIPDHTYPEFYLVDENDKGHWLPCQPAGQYEFGSMTETRPILQKGDRFKIRGHQDELRYLQPTLTAKDADVGPTIKWVMRKIEDD